MEFKIRWTEFKLLLDSQGFPFFSYQDDENYHLSGTDGGFTYLCDVSKVNKGEGFDRKELELKYLGKASKYSPRTDYARAMLGLLSSIEGKFPIQVSSSQEQAAYDPLIYSVGIASFSAASSATDIFTIRGSDKRLVKVRRIAVSLTANITLGGSTTIEALLVKRSTKNSGGTSTVLNPIQHDSKHPRSEASVVYYTVNPTLGTAVGTVRARKVTVCSINTGNPIVEIDWVFEKPILLRTSLETLAVNLNGNSITSDANAINIEWEEV